MRQIFIEKKFHAAGTVTSLRSRSAAKAMQAFRSSRVRSGKSSSICSSVHIGSKIFEHFIDCNAQSSHARLATAFVRLDRIVIVVVHVFRVRLSSIGVKKQLQIHKYLSFSTFT